MGDAHTQKTRQRISRGNAIHKKQSGDYRQRCGLKMEAEICSMTGARVSETGAKGRRKEPTRERERERERRRIRKSEGVRETDVALAGPGRLIASGPLPCQALTPLSSAVIYRLRFARFKHHSVVIMAGEGRMTFLGWEAELDPRSSRPPPGGKTSKCFSY